MLPWHSQCTLTWKQNSAKNVNQSLFINVKRKLAHEQKEKHISGVNLSVNFSVVITVAFAGSCRGVMDQGKCTPGESHTAVCGCTLQLCQAQLCSLFVGPDLQSFLKSLQKEEDLQRTPGLAAHKLARVFAKSSKHPSNGWLLHQAH